MYQECVKCGRKLKDRKSIERGYGPVCWVKAKKEEQHGAEDDGSGIQEAKA